MTIRLAYVEIREGSPEPENEFVCTIWMPWEWLRATDNDGSIVHLSVTIAFHEPRITPASLPSLVWLGDPRQSHSHDTCFDCCHDNSVISYWAERGLRCTGKQGNFPSQGEQFPGSGVPKCCGDCPRKHWAPSGMINQREAGRNPCNVSTGTIQEWKERAH